MGRQPRLVWWTNRRQTDRASQTSHCDQATNSFSSARSQKPEDSEVSEELTSFAKLKIQTSHKSEVTVTQVREEQLVAEGVGSEGSLPECLGVVDGEHHGLDEVLDRVHPSLFVLLEPLVGGLGARAAAVAADQLPMYTPAAFVLV